MCTTKMASNIGCLCVCLCWRLRLCLLLLLLLFCILLESISLLCSGKQNIPKHSHLYADALQLQQLILQIFQQLQKKGGRERKSKSEMSQRRRHEGQYHNINRFLEKKLIIEKTKHLEHSPQDRSWQRASLYAKYHHAAPSVAMQSSSAVCAFAQ